MREEKAREQEQEGGAGSRRRAVGNKRWMERTEREGGRRKELDVK